ncbi:MAG: VOC family protein [Rubrivivax sp.]
MNPHHNAVDAPVVGLHHVALAVSDMDAATRFYKDAAGLEAWVGAQAAGLPAEAQALCTRNAGLWLLPAGRDARPVRRPVNETGLAHLCVQTPRIDTVLERFEAAGARLHSPPVDLGTGFLYCYARDPEFNVIEVECVAPVWPDARPWLAHANIVTHDLPRLTTFYSALLSVPAVRSPRLRHDARLDTIADLQGVDVRASWLDAGNAQIELMQYMAPPATGDSGRRQEGVTGFVHLAFEVRDLRQACAQLLQGGGRLKGSPSTHDWQAQAFDPDGNRVLLLDLSAAHRRASRLASLADPQITQRFAAARAALITTP